MSIFNFSMVSADGLPFMVICGENLTLTLLLLVGISGIFNDAYDFIKFSIPEPAKLNAFSKGFIAVKASVFASRAFILASIASICWSVIRSSSFDCAV